MESNNQPEDQSLRDALLGVSVPAGLNQRLLSRLRKKPRSMMSCLGWKIPARLASNYRDRICRTSGGGA
ncbi:MAG: hypothetical protein R3C56_09010 [Pirellulaceae bacterium]